MSEIHAKDEAPEPTPPAELEAAQRPVPSVAHEPTWPEMAKWLGSVAAVIAVMIAATFVTPSIHVPPSIPHDSFAFRAIFYAAVFVPVLLSSLIVAWTTPAFDRRHLAFVLVCIIALFVVRIPGPTTLSIRDAAIIMAALLSGGTMIGAIVGSKIQHPGQLLVVTFIFTIADVFSVLHPAGPSHAVASSQALVQVLAVPWPVIEIREIAPVLGVGDVIAIALFVWASRKHSLSLVRTNIALVIGALVTAAIVVATEAPIPALPALSIAVVAAHPETRRLRKEDRRPALIGCLVLAALFALVWYRR